MFIRLLSVVNSIGMRYLSGEETSKSSLQIGKNSNLSTYLILIGFIFIGISANSQQVEYTVEKDDPTEIHNLNISIAPFYADAWSPNVNIGWGIEGRYILMKRLSVAANFYQSYFQITEYEGNGSPSKATYGEAVGQFAFAAKAKEVPLKVVLKSANSYTKYIMVDGQQMRKWNVRFGAGYFGSPYSANNARTDQILGPSGNPAPSDLMGTINTSGIIFGISREKYANLRVKTGDKIKGNGKFSNFYFDFIYNPVLEVPDIQVGSVVYEISNGDNGIELKNTGWRIGYEMYPRMYNPVDLTIRFEAGSRPGFKGKSFYALLSFGMGLHFL